MTVGTEGESDDPFGYLYRPGPGDAQGGGQAAPAGFGSSPYVQVGQTRYGQPQPYAAPQHPDAQATQAIPGAVPGTAPGGSPPPGQVPSPRREGGGHGGSRGTSRGGRGPVIGAVVAIVVVIAVILAVVAMNGDDKDKKAEGGPSNSNTSTSASAPPSSSQPSSAAPTSPSAATFGETEAETAALTGGATQANNANNYSGNGFVAGLTQPGAAITLTVNAPVKGKYSLNVLYANPDPAVPSGTPDRPKKTMTVLANGEAKYGQINLYGTGGADKWWTTFRTIDLKEGENKVTLACQPGDSCNVTVDKMWVTPNKS